MENEPLVIMVRNVLDEVTAPWVRDLGIEVDAAAPDGSVSVRIRNAPHLSREGGALCGQAIAALADTAMIAALTALVGEFRPMTTVSLSVNFLRAITTPEAIATVALGKVGRSLCYGEVQVRSVGTDALAAVALVTYAWVPSRSS